LNYYARPAYSVTGATIQQTSASAAAVLSSLTTPTMEMLDTYQWVHAGQWSGCMLLPVKHLGQPSTSSRIAILTGKLVLSWYLTALHVL
jgi:hypothetical protein